MGIQVLKAPKPEIMRDLFIGNYTIRYLINNGEIIILRLWHDKENDRGLDF